MEYAKKLERVNWEIVLFFSAIFPYPLEKRTALCV